MAFNGTNYVLSHPLIDYPGKASHNQLNTNIVYMIKLIITSGPTIGAHVEMQKTGVDNHFVTFLLAHWKKKCNISFLSKQE